MLWGFIQSDRSTLPVWIQAGATTMLLIITGISISATYVIADANRKLVEINQFDRESRVIKDMAKNIFLPIIRKLNDDKDFFQRGYNILRFLCDQKVKPENRIIFPDSPNYFLKRQIHDFDPILQRNVEEIKNLSIEYDNYSKRLREINMKIFNEKEVIWNDFKNLCDSLNQSESKFPNVDDYECVFTLAIADAKLNGKLNELPHMYHFFNENRDALSLFVIKSQMGEIVKEYSELREDFIPFSEQFLKIISDLFHDWQRKYYLIDSDLSDPFYDSAL